MIVSWVVVGIGVVVTFFAFISMGWTIVKLVKASRAARKSLGPFSSEIGLSVQAKSSPAYPTIGFVLKCLVPWAAFFRTLDLVIDLVVYSGNYLTRGWESQNWAVVMTTSFPNYVLMTNYMLLVVFWIWLSRKSKRSGITFVRELILTWLVAVASMFLVWVVLMMLLAALPDHMGAVHTAEVVYAAAISVFIAAFFAIWGYCLLDRMRLSAPKSSRSRRVSWKVLMLTIFCTALFLIRSVLILLCYFALQSDGAAFFTLVVIWIVGCEYIPTFFLVVVLNNVVGYAKQKLSARPLMVST